ncbi:MAG: hypothetical protein JNN15_15680, partial [Blastocatellia bacterium]|nr:hypothetical protein [Blastocatellia bacterium]
LPEVVVVKGEDHQTENRVSKLLRHEPFVRINPLVDTLLSIDDGVADQGLGGSDPGFGWFNMLKPDSYPATLKEVLVAFNSGSRGVASGAPFRIQVYRDPESNGPENGQRPDINIGVTANSPGNFERYTLPQQITIDQGSFFVGVVDPIFVADLPALIDQPGTVRPSGSRSFFTTDNGRTFQSVSQTFPGFGINPGSWMIRAVADVEAPQPVITRAFYRKNKLRIIGRNLNENTVVRINNQRVNVKPSFNNDEGKLTIKGTTQELNIRPSGQSNRLVVIVDGVASEAFEFTT